MATFLQVMRDVYRVRQAGVSLHVAFLMLDDDELDVIWHRLVQVAMLDSRLRRYRRRA